MAEHARPTPPSSLALLRHPCPLGRGKSLMLAVLLACCGTEDAPPEPAACVEHAASEYDAASGWGGDYCNAPTDLGCYPWKEVAADTCGEFVSMRTTATEATAVGECRTLLTSLNCGTYTADDGSELTFNVLEPDRFTMRAVGTYGGAAVDTTFYFNPCHQSCLSAVTLDTLDPDQQKVCDIPTVGKPVCLFPGTAHSLTFVRADSASLVIRTANKETAMSRVVDE